MMGCITEKTNKRNISDDSGFSEHRMKSYISKIRELTNKPILKSLLLKDRKKWNLMCGSLDAIESAQLAIDSYRSLDEHNIKDVGQHLVIYGFFQALYVQQDSVTHLCESVGIRLPDMRTHFPELYEIRQLRNKAIGHPSKQGATNNTHSMLIEKDSIELFSYTEGGEFSFKEYNVSECIDKQEKALCGFMQQVIERMKSLEKEHKSKYMQNRFRDCFPPDAQYCIGKVFEAINLIEDQIPEETTPQRIGREGGISLALSHTKTLIDAVDRFYKEITERGLRDGDVVFIHLGIDRAKYPLEKLKEYFSPGSKSYINSQDARAYADSAREHILELVRHAEHLDNEYASTA